MIKEFPTKCPMKQSNLLLNRKSICLTILVLSSLFLHTVNAQDTDGDGIIDIIENASTSPDLDGISNNLDVDSDDDSISDAIEYGVDVSGVNFALDADTDGIPDAMDASSGGTDTNSNDIVDSFEPIDSDGDGVPDYLDLDSDNDGIHDVDEHGFSGFDTNNDGRITADPGIDVNGNGQVDATEGSMPTNTVGVTPPNYINIDSDSDGCVDALEAEGTFAPSSLDIDGSFGDLVDANGVPNATPNGQPNAPAVTDSLDTTTCDAFVDSDSDGITDGVDLDDDNDGILDFDECQYNAVVLGPFTNANTSFDFTGTGGAGPASLNSITHQGVQYSDFLVPDGYQENFVSTNSNHIYEVNNNVDGNTGGAAGNNILNPMWNNIILPAFQSNDFNYYQKQDGGITTTDYYTLQYNTPIKITGDSFILISERGGNNNTTIEAYDVNGTYLGSQIVLVGSSANYLPTGTTTSNGQEIQIAVYALTDLGQPGQEIGSLRMLSASTGDGPDGKVFIVANTPICPDDDDDGIANQFDLDSDNDGISDVIESGGSDDDMDGLADDDNNNANNAGSNGIPSTAGTGTTAPNSDGNPNDLPDYLDIDADDDGIPDNVEGQPTATYQPPSGIGNTMTDVNMNGLDDNYENGALIGIDPENTDSTDNPDYLDDDSDNDGILDIEENGDTDNSPSNMDTDGDGLDDAFDDNDDSAVMGATVNDGINPPDATNLGDADGDLGTGGDVDYRDANEIDTDGDGVLDSQEISDGTDPDDPCDYLVASITEPQSGAWLTTDCDGDGIVNGTEVTDGTDPLDPCDPTQMEGYTGYDATNAIWSAADCDGDTISNGQEDTDGTDPYDPCSSRGGTPPAGTSCDIEIDTDLVQPGINDGIFRIINIESYPDNDVKIYNRWGVLVFQTPSYDNEARAFRGISNGRSTVQQEEELPVGVYFYIINYVKDGVANTKSGYLYVNR